MKKHEEDGKLYVECTIDDDSMWINEDVLEKDFLTAYLESHEAKTD